MVGEPDGADRRCEIDRIADTCKHAVANHYGSLGESLGAGVTWSQGKDSSMSSFIVDSHASTIGSYHFIRSFTCRCVGFTTSRELWTCR